MLLFSGLLFSPASSAAGGIDPADPMVKITSPSTDLDIPAALAAVSKDVSAATGVKESFITYFWQTFDHVIYEGAQNDKPLFVDLYVPGFFSDEDVQSMMKAVADALVEHVGVDRPWLFIHTHFPLPEQVYIGGGVAKWDVYRGQPSTAPRDKADRAPGKFLFNDAAFAFQSLWRFGLAATGASDLGELLTIVSKVEDYALARPEVDPDRVAIIGYSMGGYLTPRALAFEKRIRWGVADGGVFSVFDGTMTKFPAEVLEAVAQGDQERANELVYAEMESHAKTRQFINQMLWTFGAKNPFELFQKLRR